MRGWGVRDAGREPERLLVAVRPRVAEGPDEPREHRGQQAVRSCISGSRSSTRHGAVADQEDGRDEHRRRAEAPRT